jgi:hypothetical protein
VDKVTVVEEDTSGIVAVGQTLTGHNGFSWNTAAADGATGADFDSGVLTLYYRPKHPGSTVWMYLDVPAADEQATYNIGQNMEIGMEFVGSTAPDLSFLIGQL